MSKNILQVAMTNGRTARYGDFVIITLQSVAFATTAMEYQQVQMWARAKASHGNPHRDRMAFTERFETVLARSGGGLASKGSKKVLAAIVKAMIANGVLISEWSVPHGLNDSVEIKPREKPADPAAAAAKAAPAVVAAIPVFSTEGSRAPVITDKVL